MKALVDFFRDFNIYTIAIRLLLALILGGLVGVEREKHGQAAGLRTHILVCLGSTMVMMVGLYAKNILHLEADPLRIGAQVVSGIGFIGAGTILVRSGKHIKGLTTASGLWCTAAMGLAIGIGFYEGALLCAIMILIVMVVFKSLDRTLSGRNDNMYIYFEIQGLNNVNNTVEAIKQANVQFSVVEITASKSASKDNLGIIVKVKDINITAAEQIILSIENVLYTLQITTYSDI